MDPITPVASLIPMILFGAVWLAALVTGLVGYVILLVALWRFMRAHESIAISLKTWVSSRQKT
jgi:hypothetical protein